MTADVQGIGLERCETLLADFLVAAVARFGDPALGVIDLPPLEAGARIAPEQLKVAGILLWAMEVEDAGLPSFADALAERFAQGRLLLSGEGAKLYEYWRERHERFEAPERRAIYRRIFGDPSDPSSVISRFEALCSTLAELAHAKPEARSHAIAQARAQALQLAADLSSRTVGIAAFAAREITAHIRAALALLRDPQLGPALGGAGTWSTIRSLAPSVLGRTIDPLEHVERARAGLAVLEWLADSARALENGSLHLGPNSRVVREAEAWRIAKGAR